VPELSAGWITDPGVTIASLRARRRRIQVVSSNITELLAAWREGNQEARDRLVDAVYGELRRLAHHHLRRERAGHTLQTTALAHDAYLQLVDQRKVQWQSRAHFFGIAAHLIRRILVEYARRRSRKAWT
jgi:RNA polymerase sigma factor (TIGR02999 family)